MARSFEQHLWSVLEATLDKDLLAAITAHLESKICNSESMLNLANQMIAVQELRNLSHIGISLQGIDKTLDRFQQCIYEDGDAFAIRTREI